MAPARVRVRSSGRIRAVREPIDLAPWVPAVDAASSDRCAYGLRSDSLCNLNESLRTPAFSRSRLAANASFSAATIAASISFGAAPTVLDTDVAALCGDCGDAETSAIAGAAWTAAREKCAVGVTAAGWAAAGGTDTNDGLSFAAPFGFAHLFPCLRARKRNDPKARRA